MKLFIVKIKESAPAKEQQYDSYQALLVCHATEREARALAKKYALANGDYWPPAKYIISQYIGMAAETAPCVLMHDYMNG